MMRKKRCLLFILTLLLIITPVLIYRYQENSQIDLINEQLQLQPSSAGLSKFVLLDATDFSDTLYPWIGFHVRVISENDLLGSDYDGSSRPNEVKVKQFLYEQRSKSKRRIYDISSWNLNTDDHEMAQKYISWYLLLIQWTKEIMPEADVGFLGMPYSPWNSLNSGKVNRESYQKVYQKIKPVLDLSDSIYPRFDLIVFDDNFLSFDMGAHLYIAKESGKPVFPVLSHRSFIIGTDQNELVPFNLLKQQCRFVRANAEGMVWISAKNETWDDRWYHEVVDFCFSS